MPPYMYTVQDLQDYPQLQAYLFADMIERLEKEGNCSYNFHALAKTLGYDTVGED